MSKPLPRPVCPPQFRPFTAVGFCHQDCVNSVNLVQLRYA